MSNNCGSPSEKGKEENSIPPAKRDEDLPSSVTPLQDEGKQSPPLPLMGKEDLDVPRSSLRSCSRRVTDRAEANEAAAFTQKEQKRKPYPLLSVSEVVVKMQDRKRRMYERVLACKRRHEARELA